MSRVRMAVALFRFIPSTLALLACRQINPEFCRHHPADVDCVRLSGLEDACTADLDCSPSTPICDLARATCVACTADRAGACGDATPVCGAGQTCRSCALDGECASRTCLPDGSCAPVLDVLYVNPNATDLATCMPDDHCSLARALSLVDGTKATIRLDPAVYSLLASRVLPNDLHLVGRDATIQRDAAGSGPTLIVPTSANITIDYVTVQGGDGNGAGIQCLDATLTLRAITVQGNAGAGIQSSNSMLLMSGVTVQGNAGPGIQSSNSTLAMNGVTVKDNTGVGIACTGGALTMEDGAIQDNADVGILGSSCELSIARSRIQGNEGAGIVVSRGGLALARSRVLGNRGGGVSLQMATYDLENDVIAENGGPGATVGGVAISSILSPVGHVFAFNTVARNQNAGGSVPGVACSGVAMPVPMTSSIVFDNGSAAQVEGSNCVWTYSAIGSSAGTPVPAGAGNVAGDPRFVDPDHHDYHLQAASPARDAADPSATLAIDIDGDTRPQGARPDIGADEIP